ncbi:type I restriction endonuclease subunit R [Streptomyces sp. PR69]|uniref:type I restriction endonuclease subunit R n=1 Tax=Streptomyces sp. PR69 TaxID=2984950 RepID=UPI0022651FF3|nr:HsdR family type I site-specific deoxyribonuclease [Streptomyces sp. PR69]
MVESDPEHRYVEAPLIAQLANSDMGWRHVRGTTGVELQAPSMPLYVRDGYEDAVLERILRAKLVELNRRPDGTPWVDEARADQAISALTRGAVAAGGGLVAANEAATRVLLEGADVPGLEDWDGGRNQTVRFIDWQNPERNDFLAVSQFRMAIPGSQGETMVADVVLFVNGIPLAVIECKKPAAVGGDVFRAVDQLRRYANQTEDTILPRGSDRLFRTVQLTVATTGDKALLGTFTARRQDYVLWRDPYPLKADEVAARSYHPSDRLFAAQKILAAGVLHPQRLLDIVRNFVLFRDVEVAEERTARVKIGPRYQQYRAVCKAVERLHRGETKAVHGKDDKRGGIIWHTQGSGKSLTMVFLVRKLRATPGLEHLKVVVVTDRKQLQEQLSDTAVLTGEKPDTVTRADQVPVVLARKGAGLVFVMIQKQQDAEKAKAQRAASVASVRPKTKVPGWGLVNDDEGILILVDEAHRSHGSDLHENLMESLPNAARIGFTGTPIIMNRRKLTETTFGDFIDKYRIADAELDGAIVPIYYEGHIAKGAVQDGDALDEAMEEEFEELTDEQYDELQKRYATSTAVLGADHMIRRKARHMLRHYVQSVLPEGFKAQVVAHSRGIAVCYRKALQDARDELVDEVEALSDSRLKRLLDTRPEDLKPKQKTLVSAYRNLRLLKAIDFVPVISEGENDDRSWQRWTKESDQKKAIKSFRSPFPAADQIDETSRPVAFLIVRTMLLTGFDAPIEQVMYLDRRMKEAELLQAVARVNRTADRKTAGIVVDYAGVAKALVDAMAVYAADEREGKPIDFEVEENRLETQCAALRHHFQLPRELIDPDDVDAVNRLVDTLEEDKHRFEFRRLLRDFLETYAVVTPRESARPYAAAVRLFTFVAGLAKQRFSEEDGFNPAAYGKKVEQLINQHVRALGVDKMIEPSRLTSEEFKTRVEQLPGSRAKASMMKHALRNHIDLHFGKNPVAYEKLRQRVEEILKKHADDWEAQLAAFEQLAQEAKDVDKGAGRDLPEDVRGLSSLEQALYQQLTAVLTDGVIDDAIRGAFVTLSQKVHDLAVRHSVKPGFWTNPAALHDFRSDIWLEVVTCPHTREKADFLADALRDIIQHNQKELGRPRA